MQTFKLCQVAHKLRAQDHEEDQYIFEYNNSKWCLEENLFQHSQAIKDILLNCKALNLKKVVVEDQQELIIVFSAEEKNRQAKYEISSILSQLLSIICNNYKVKDDLYIQLLQEDFQQKATSSSTKLIKTYCTTQLYDALFEAHKRALTPNKTTAPLKLPEDFGPVLYKFQERTVHWLLEQEQTVKYLPNLWIELLPCAGSNGLDLSDKFYKHKYCMAMQKYAPQPVELPKGGILADEMGLGKTVEMLALIILHPRIINYELLVKQLLAKNITADKVIERKENIFCICHNNKPNSTKKIQCSRCRRWQHAQCVQKFDRPDSNISAAYVCPACWYELTVTKPLPTRATIIVSPNSIRAQWLSEVKRHAPALRVFCYDAHIWINPIELGDYDLVLTDYQVLQSEFYHTHDFISDRKTRKAPRSMRRFTPLLMLQWYRVCLDEAQVIDANTSKSAELVAKLPAVNRWAVTGTPITSSINDLLPLLKFIGLWEIYNPIEIWKTLTHNFLLSCNKARENESTKNMVDQPIIEILQTCMWRTCKRNISTEYEIPPQEERVHYINLMDLEKLNYMEQHSSQDSAFSCGLSKYAKSNEWGLRTISARILKILLKPLNKLRQCCTMPTIGSNLRNGNILGTAHNQRFLQPGELMTHMKAANEGECKGALRSMASSYNGMAAVQFILENYSEAIRFYQQVLKLARDHKNNTISVDSLLQMHAIYNLLEANKALTATSADNIGKLSSQDVYEYEKQYSDMEKKYLESYKDALYNVKKLYDKANEVLTINSENNLIENVSVLLDGLNIEQSDILFNKIFYDCRSLYPNADKFENMQSLNGLLLFLNFWQENLSSKRLQIIELLKTLDFLTENCTVNATVNLEKKMDLVQSVFNCHLSEIREKDDPPPAKKSKKGKCILCKCDCLLNAYFCLMYDQEMTNEDDARTGTERCAVEVHILRTIFNFVRAKCKIPALKETINSNLETLEALQNFYHRTSKYWIEVEYTVKAYDELDMCKMRISLTENKEEKSNFRILAYELDEFFQTQQIQFNDAQLLFSRKYARLKYLQHLGDKTDHGPCPVCCAEMNVRYAVLECGHHLCLECLCIIKKQTKLNKMDCVLCRNKQDASNVFYVTKRSIISNNNNDDDNIGNIETNGMFSSKITYVLRVLLRLRQMDESVKVLIFSKWQQMLMAITDALKMNNISYCMQRNAKNIADFKNPKLNIMCLLMPLNNGSKGLNLIEATHVFLLEPILNPGEELQALGRVHRLGQTKPTMVHRFIVCNTIEENIFNVTSKKKNTHGSNWEYKDMTLQDIEQLFVLKNDVSDQQL